MNLLYVYIVESKNGLIKKQGFNFSKEFDIEYTQNELCIDDRVNYVDYPKHIYNISALVGENGSGKSTIIQSIRDCGVDDKNVYFIFMKDDVFYSNQKINIKYRGKTSIAQDLTEKVLMIYTASNMASSEIFDNSINGLLFQNGEGFVEHSQFKYVYDCSNLGIEKSLRTENDNHSLNLNDFIYFLVLKFLANNSNYEDKILGNDVITSIFLKRTTEHRVTKLLLPNDSISNTDTTKLLHAFSEIYNTFNTYLVMNDIQLQIKYSIVLFYLDTLLETARKNINRGAISFSQLLLDSKELPEFNQDDSLYSIINKLNCYISPLTVGLNYLNTTDDFLNTVDDLIKNINVVQPSKGNDIILSFDEESQNLIHQLLIGGYANLFTIKPLDSRNREIFLSAGEISLLSLFAKIEYIIEPFQIKNGFELININQIRNTKTMILLLDEPDSYLHPNWSRELIDYLIEYLEDKFNKYDLQIILSSNNPFMLSDIYASNVIKLKKDKSNKQIEMSHPTKETFGSNIHELLNDTFFMKNTIGEYSYNQIKFVIQLISPLEGIHKSQEEIRKAINQKFNIDLEGKDIYEFLYRKINNIGENILREKMLSILDDCFNSFCELDKLKLQRKKLDERIRILETEGVDQ